MTELNVTYDASYQERRERELRPLADALTIGVRGFGVTLPNGDSDVRIENTGGDVYCVVGTLGAWTVYANEEGWSIDDADGSLAIGGWGAVGTDDEYRVLPMDEDTDALDEGECDVAAVMLRPVIERLTS